MYKLFMPIFFFGITTAVTASEPATTIADPFENPNDTIAAYNDKTIKIASENNKIARLTEAKEPISENNASDSNETNPLKSKLEHNSSKAQISKKLNKEDDGDDEQHKNIKAEHTGKILQVGQASWYGRPFHGRKTASGTIFDMYKMTAAHKTMPLNTRVRVTNLASHKSVVVLVNDRGPYVGGRILDLSYAAARAIGIYGVGRVRIEALR